MAWSTIRRATTDDICRLNAAAKRFVERHNLNPNGLDVPDVPWESLVEDAIYREEEECRAYGGRRKLANAWARIVRRALQSPNAEGIAHGYIGFSVQ